MENNGTGIELLSPIIESTVAVSRDRYLTFKRMTLPPMTQPLALLSGFLVLSLVFVCGYARGLKGGRNCLKKCTAKAEEHRAAEYADTYRLLSAEDEDMYWQLRYQSYLDGLRMGLASAALTTNQ